MMTVMWQPKPSWSGFFCWNKQQTHTFHFLCHLQLLVWGQHRRKAGQTWQRWVVRGWWMCVTWILMSHFGCQQPFHPFCSSVSLHLYCHFFPRFSLLFYFLPLSFFLLLSYPPTSHSYPCLPSTQLTFTHTPVMFVQFSPPTVSMSALSKIVINQEVSILKCFVHPYSLLYQYRGYN